MAFLVVSFIAGVLTVLAPCILPLLPVVIGASASGRSKFTPYIVVGSLGLSIIIFTYLLKASTAFIMVPPQFWTYLSGGIILLFGLTLVFPALWEKIPGIAKVARDSNKLVGTGYQKKSFWGDVTIGAALGPVFSTCSPTYFVILASVLPASFLLGTVYLLAYVLGLSIILLMLAFLGDKLSKRLSGLADSRGWFKKTIGVIFIILGLMIVSGLEKKLETHILENGYFDITKVEQNLLQGLENKKTDSKNNDDVIMPFVEISNPSGFVNTDKITIGELVGKKVILVDFMTYSCINCQRTFPYITAWYDKYKDQGLEIVGIHTPEFAFEKDIRNVEKAMEEFGIKFPVVLDNDYGTWRAWENSFWPRKYLIDIHGNVVYDHIGEGEYAETEKKIQELLEERDVVLGMNEAETNSLISDSIPEVKISSRSPETYFGFRRNEFLQNGQAGVPGRQTLTLPDNFVSNALYMGGTWNINSEYAQSVENSEVVYRFNSKDVYMVARSDIPVEIEVWQDEKFIKNITISESKLYTLIGNESSDSHLLRLKIKGAGVEIYTFTFG